MANTNLKESRDLANQLAEALSRSSGYAENMVTKFRDINKHVRDAYYSAEEWEGKYKSIDKFEKAINKGGKMKKQLLEQVAKLQKKELTEYYQEVNKKIYAIEDTLHKGIKTLEEKNELEKERIELIDEQYKFGKRLQKIQEEELKILREKGTMLEKIKKMFSTESLLGAFSAVADKAWSFIKNVFKAIIQDAERMLKIAADTNKEFGNMGAGLGQVKKQALATGKQFELLGLGFERGKDAVIAMSSAMMQTKIPKETLSLGLKLSEYVGLGAERAGEMMHTFQRTGTGVKVLNDFMSKGAVTLSKEYGVPVNKIRKDIGQYPEVLHRFGTANIMEFGKAAAVARSYGVDIGKINAALGENYDSFDKTSDVATKLNAAFGTQINSLELMMTTDPTERMKLIGKELENQRIKYDELSVFEKNSLKNITGLSEAELIKINGSRKAREELMKKEKAQARAMKQDEDWAKGVRNLRTEIFNFQEGLNKIYVSIGNLISRFFGFSTGGNAAIKTGTVLNKAFVGLSKVIDTFASKIDPKKNNIADLSKILESLPGRLERMFKMIERIGDSKIFKMMFGDVDAEKKVSKEYKYSMEARKKSGQYSILSGKDELMPHSAADISSSGEGLSMQARKKMRINNNNNNDDIKKLGKSIDNLSDKLDKQNRDRSETYVEMDGHKVGKILDRGRVSSARVQ